MKKIISVIASLMLAVFVVAPIGGEAIEVPNNRAATRVSFSAILTPRTDNNSEVLSDGEEETSSEQETTEGEILSTSEEETTSFSTVDSIVEDSSIGEEVDSTEANPSSNGDAGRQIFETTEGNSNDTSSEPSSSESSSEPESSSNSGSSESEISSSGVDSLSNADTSDNGFGNELWFITIAAFGVGIFMTAGKKEDNI